MNCRFCGALNSREDQRCLRCGRRLHPAKAQPAPETYPLRDSTVPLFAPESNAGAEIRTAAPSVSPDGGLDALRRAVSSPGADAQAEIATASAGAPADPAKRSRPVAYQQSLFHEMGTVIPFPPLESAPKTRRSARNGATTTTGRTKTGPKRSSASSVKNSATPPAQSLSFDFMLPDLPGETKWMGERGIAASSLAGQTGPAGENRVGEPDLYCDAPVAPMSARVIASVMDMALVSGAFAVLASIYYLAVHQTAPAAPAFVARAVLPYGILFALVAVLYKGLYALANADSAGTRWANLKVINFDGEAPTRQERISRMVWSCLSVAAVGTGLLWSLVDEEQLTWHDLLSRTFACERNQ